MSIMNDLSAFLRKATYILREEGLFTFADRARRAMVVRVKRALEDGRPNQARWNALKGRYRGKRAFLIGNGPSLNRTPLHLLKGEYTLCFNRFNLMFERMPWRPTFYATIDDRVLQDMGPELAEILPQVELAFFPDLHPYNIDFRRSVPAADNVYWLWLDRVSFADDLPYCGINKTVANVGLQILAYLGFTDIYLLGVDMDYQDHRSAAKHNARDWTATKDDDPNHFDPRYFGAGRSYHHPRLDETIEKFKEAKAFFDARGVRIMNAGVGGKLEVFPRVRYRDLFSVPPMDELALMLEVTGVRQIGSTLEETFPEATICLRAEDWQPNVEVAILPAEVGLQVLPKAIFTHLPLGPFAGKYVILSRARLGTDRAT